MSLSLNLLQDVLTKKHWVNKSYFCNGKTHPYWVNYRKYRRGKNRCLVCGARIGKIKCKFQSFRDQMIENVFKPNILLSHLIKKKETQ